MDRDRWEYEVLRRYHFRTHDPDVLAAQDELQAAIMRRSEDIVESWSWADRAAIASEQDDNKSLGALLAMCAQHFRSLPEPVQQAFRAVEQAVNANADKLAETELLGDMQ